MTDLNVFTLSSQELVRLKVDLAKIHEKTLELFQEDEKQNVFGLVQPDPEYILLCNKMTVKLAEYTQDERILEALKSLEYNLSLGFSEFGNKIIQFTDQIQASPISDAMFFIKPAYNPEEKTSVYSAILDFIQE